MLMLVQNIHVMFYLKTVISYSTTLSLFSLAIDIQFLNPNDFRCSSAAIGYLCSSDAMPLRQFRLCY